MSPASPDTLNATAQGRLRTIVERIERLDEEKAEIGGHIKEVFAEAKGEGFDVKILRRVIAYRKQDRAKRQEEEAVLDLYLSALGELPLFEPREPETHVSIRFGDGVEVGGIPSEVRAALAEVTATIGRAPPSSRNDRPEIVALLVQARQADGGLNKPHHRSNLAKALESAIEAGLMERVGDRAELTLRGQDVADEAIARAREQVPA